MRQNTTKTRRPRLQHKHPPQLLRDAEMFDEILTHNQESLPKNSTNGADIFLKKHFGKSNGGMTTVRVGHSRAAAHLNVFLLTLLISHLVRLFCACGLFGHYGKMQ